MKLMYMLWPTYFWNSFQLSNVRDSKAEKEIHEDKSHDQDEDEEEYLGDERGVLGVDEVGGEVKLSHQHRQNLNKSVRSDPFINPLWWRHFRGFQRPGWSEGERGRWGRRQGTRWWTPWRTRKLRTPPEKIRNIQNTTLTQNRIIWFEFSFLISFERQFAPWPSW